MRFRTKSPRETRKIAGQVAKKIAKQKPASHAVIIGLVGDLGSGKTTFVGGFARALGIRRRMVSPTFTVMRRHALPKSSPAYRHGFRSLVHVDAYRVHKPGELEVIKFESWLADPTAIILIEWADLVQKLLPRHSHTVQFKHLRHGKREVRVTGT